MEQWHAGSTPRCRSARIGRLGDSGKDTPAALRRARRDPPLGRGATSRCRPAAPAGCSSPTSATASAAGRCAGRCSPSTTNGSASPRRSSAATTRSPSCSCRTSAASATATGSSRPSPTACAPARGSRSSACRSRTRNAPSTPPTEQRLVSARHHLRGVRDMPLEPFGDFLAAVAHLAERDAGADGRAARDYLDAFSKRRQIVAQSSGKYELLGEPRPGDQATPTARSCSPRRCAPRTTPSTGSIRTSRST